MFCFLRGKSFPFSGNTAVGGCKASELLGALPHQVAFPGRLLGCGPGLCWHTATLNERWGRSGGCRDGNSIWPPNAPHSTERRCAHRFSFLVLWGSTGLSSVEASPSLVSLFLWDVHPGSKPLLSAQKLSLGYTATTCGDTVEGRLGPASGEAPAPRGAFKLQSRAHLESKHMVSI